MKLFGSSRVHILVFNLVTNTQILAIFLKEKSVLNRGGILVFVSLNRWLVNGRRVKKACLVKAFDSWIERDKFDMSNLILPVDELSLCTVQIVKHNLEFSVFITVSSKKRLVLVFESVGVTNWSLLVAVRLISFWSNQPSLFCKCRVANVKYFGCSHIS